MTDVEVAHAASSPADAVSVNVDEPGSHEDDRPKWSSRWVFWLAAVGSAVGLGNLWRFPWQCNYWGGGPFLIAYFTSLFLIGMPLLTQELACGHRFRSGDIEAFGKMNWRLRGIGLASVVGAFGIVSYYAVVIAISCVFFFASMQKNLPYGSDAAGASWWFTDVLMGANGIEDSEYVMSGYLFLATGLVWILIFCSIFKGVESASLAVKITMPLPLLLLFVLLIKGATLKGAGDGIKQFLNLDDWGRLGDSDLWNAAVGQCFFSLSVCMGVMTAYGSYNPHDQDIATDEKVIGFLDVGVSIISGFVVYSVLGYLTRKDPDGGWYESATFGLVFSAYPAAIEAFGSGGAQFFGIIFFSTLFLLGIDSAFSMVEALGTVLYDSHLGKRLGWSRMKISAVMCAGGMVMSSLFCFDTGIFWLDIVDHYINLYGMVFLGICECIAAGWFFKYEEQAARVGDKAIWTYDIGCFSILVSAITVGITFAFPVDAADGSGLKEFTGGAGSKSWLIGFIPGIFAWCVLVWYSIRVSRSERPNAESRIWYLIGWIGNEDLRSMINANGLGIDEAAWKAMRHTWAGEFRAGYHHSCVGIWWGFLVKYFMPTVLSVILISQMREESYNPYEGYPWGYLMVGILIFALMVVMVAVVGYYPELMAMPEELEAVATKTGEAIAMDEIPTMDAHDMGKSTDEILVNGDKDDNLAVVSAAPETVEVSPDAQSDEYAEGIASTEQ